MISTWLGMARRPLSQTRSQHAPYCVSLVCPNRCRTHHRAHGLRVGGSNSETPPRLNMHLVEFCSSLTRCWLSYRNHHRLFAPLNSCYIRSCIAVLVRTKNTVSFGSDVSHFYLALRKTNRASCNQGQLCRTKRSRSLSQTRYKAPPQSSCWSCGDLCLAKKCG